MGWKTDLDKYLTKSPFDDNREAFFENVVDAFSESFFDIIEPKLDDLSHFVNIWIETLYCKEYSPKTTAEIIERGYFMYNKKQKNARPR